MKSNPISIWNLIYYIIKFVNNQLLVQKSIKEKFATLTILWGDSPQPLAVECHQASQLKATPPLPHPSTPQRASNVESVSMTCRHNRGSASTVIPKLLRPLSIFYIQVSGITFETFQKSISHFFNHIVMIRKLTLPYLLLPVPFLQFLS